MLESSHMFDELCSKSVESAPELYRKPVTCTAFLNCSQLSSMVPRMTVVFRQDGLQGRQGASNVAEAYFFSIIGSFWRVPHLLFLYRSRSSPSEVDLKKSDPKNATTYLDHI